MFIIDIMMEISNWLWDFEEIYQTYICPSALSSSNSPGSDTP